MVVRFRPRVGNNILGKSRGAARATQRDANAAMRTVVNEYKRWMDHVKTSSVDALLEAFGPTLTLAKKYAPKEFGGLRASGYLEARRDTKGGIIEIGFGRYGEPDYAVYVHERVDVKHASPTRAKYLETALNEDSTAILGRLIKGLKEASGA